MAERNIPISPKYGVNPSLALCYFCGREKGVALLGRLPDDAEAPREGIFDREPCDECAAAMKQCILFMVIRDGESGKDNPYRTGELYGVKEEAVRRLNLPEPLLARILKYRSLFIEESDARALGLSMEQQPEDKENKE